MPADCKPSFAAAAKLLGEGLGGGRCVLLGRLGAWICANLFLYGCQRVAVSCGLPYDGKAGWKDARFLLENMNHLCLYACGAAIFAHVLTPKHAGSLFGKPSSCAAFLGTALGIGLLFSAVSDIDALREAISSSGTLDTSMIFVLTLLGFVVLVFFAFQIWLAHKNGGVVYYLAPRFVLILAYVAYSWALVANGDSWHFHHFFLAWIASLFCCFDHPVSVFCLAATTGIFVQGVAAYGTAELFTKAAK